MNFVMSVCDELVVLDFGRKISERHAGAMVRNDPAVIAAYLGEEENARSAARDRRRHRRSVTEG